MKCKNCGAEFEPQHGAQKHCCDYCRQQYAWRRSNQKRYDKDAETERARKNLVAQRYYLEHCEEIKLKQKIYRMTGVWKRGRLET